MRKIHELFAGRDDVHGTYTLVAPSGVKVAIKGDVRREPVTEKLWSQHLRGDTPLGIVPVRPDGTCSWFAIDVDDYETPNLHVRLAHDIKKLQLPLLIFATKSGGAHLYCFMTEPMEAKIARQVAARFISALNLSETTEIFPKQDTVKESDVGSWINMPYFGNERKCLGLSGDTPLSLEEFLYVASQTEVHPSELTQVKKETPPDPAPVGHSGAPPCVQQMLVKGVHEGGRNNACLHMGLYFKKAFPDDFEEKLHDWNGILDEPLPFREVNTIIGQLHKKEYQYLCQQPPMSTLCDKQTCLKREFGVGEKSSDSLPSFLPMSLRIVGDDMYYLTVEGGYTIMTNAEDMMNHRKVITEFFKKHGIIFEQLKNTAWWPMLNELTLNATREPAPMEIGAADKVVETFKDWVARKLGAGMTDPDKGGVRYSNKVLQFRGSELIKHINRVHSDLTDRDIFAALNEDGSEYKKGSRYWSYRVKEEWFEVNDDKDMF